jgi:hypothetical protein
MHKRNAEALRNGDCPFANPSDFDRFVRVSAAAMRRYAMGER